MQTTINNVLKNLNFEHSNTDQLYGLAYILILDIQNENINKEDIVDQILLSNRKRIIKNTEIIYIHEGINLNNYFISHYYNFSLNLLCYVGLKTYSKSYTYRSDEIQKIICAIEIFLSIEKEFLNNNEEKTIGFELVIGNYIDQVKNFSDLEFIQQMKGLRKKRISKFSKIFLFTPEGFSGLFIKLYIKYGLKQIEQQLFDSVFVLNSPETTIYQLNNEKQIENSNFNEFISYLKIHKGTPNFFQGEIYDITWIVDILHSADLLNEELKETLIKQIQYLDLYSHFYGCFNNEKGFSIAKGFPLYDLDTTSMALKSFYLLNIHKKDRTNFSLTYYINKKNNLFFTYKNDNRISITVLAHTLDYLMQDSRIDENIILYLNKCITNSNYIDKFHASKLYVLYCLCITYTNLVLKDIKYISYLDKIVKDILNYKKEILFTSIDGIKNGIIEETCWAIIALNYYKNRFNSKDNNIIHIISRAKKYIIDLNPNIYELEKIWIVKQIYTPININTILLESVKNL